MRIVKNAQLPEKKSTYDFDSLRLNDAIDVRSYSGCKEMFRRWRIFNGKNNVKLLYAGKSPENETLHRFFYVKK